MHRLYKEHAYKLEYKYISFVIYVNFDHAWAENLNILGLRLNADGLPLATIAQTQCDGFINKDFPRNSE